MGKFIIQPHGRLQEWIAHEKGYFRDEGLDYEFVRGPSAESKKNVDAAGKVTDLMSGAFESYKHAGGNTTLMYLVRFRKRSQPEAIVERLKALGQSANFSVRLETGNAFREQLA